MFKLLRKFKGYRTLALSAVPILVGIATMFGIVVEPDVVVGLIEAIFGVALALLRFDTDTPVGG